MLQVSETLKELSVDGVLFNDAYNIRHVSHFAGGEGYLYLTDAGMTLFVDSRYTLQAKEETEGIEVVEYQGEFYDTFAAYLEKDGIRRLGFEGESLLFSEYETLKNHAAQVELRSVGNYFSKRRSVKEDWELDLLARAEAIGDAAFEKILGVIRPGMTELMVAAYLEFYMKEAGAEGLGFDTIVASGIHSSMPHAIPTQKCIEAGDVLTMDFGCRYRGYCSDMTRTIVIGKASEAQKKVYAVVLEAQLAALSGLEAGKKGNEVDKIARDVIEKAGYGAYFGHGLGHSVGLFIHEEPRLSKRCDEVLLPGVVETVEPGIYLPGAFGVRIEDMVVVEKGGCRNLTKSPKELIIL